MPVNANIVIANTTESVLGVELNSEFDKTKELHITIPLLNPTFNINTVIPTSVTQSVYVTENRKIDPNRVLETIGSIGICICTIIFTLLSTTNKRFKSTKELYYEAVDTLIFKYEQIIVKVDNFDNFKDLKIVNVKEFDDLLDIEEELSTPILYYEDTFKKESYFVIVKGPYQYRYSIKSVDYEVHYS